MADVCVLLHPRAPPNYIFQGQFGMWAVSNFMWAMPNNRNRAVSHAVSAKFHAPRTLQRKSSSGRCNDRSIPCFEISFHVTVASFAHC